MYITKENINHINLDKKAIRNMKCMCKFIRKEMKRNRSMINAACQEKTDEECRTFIGTMIESIAKAYNHQHSPEYAYYDYDLIGDILHFDTFVDFT